jgi:hypothetical protein
VGVVGSAIFGLGLHPPPSCLNSLPLGFVVLGLPKSVGFGFTVGTLDGFLFRSVVSEEQAAGSSECVRGGEEGSPSAFANRRPETV